MLYRAKNGTVCVDGVPLDYVAFGYGETPLVMIPGVGDGLKTVKGMALALAITFRECAKSHRVYVFSRPRVLQTGCGTKEMAQQLADAMKQLGISAADVFGVSQGGMIAQHLAIDYPELVRKLVLAVTLARPNPTIYEVVDGWLALAEKQDYKGIMIDSAEKAYSAKYLKKYRKIYSLLGLMPKPKSMQRFIIQATACKNHNTYDSLSSIQCPTLVLGGSDDRVVGSDAADELANAIAGSKLHVYEGLGHGAYEEAKDFNSRVLTFFLAQDGK